MNIMILVTILIAIILIAIILIAVNKKNNFMREGYFIPIFILLAIGFGVFYVKSNNEVLTAVSYYNKNYNIRLCDLPINGKRLKSDAVSSTSYKIKNNDVDKFDELIQYSFTADGTTFDFITCYGEYIQYKRIDDKVTLSENISFENTDDGKVIYYVAPKGMKTDVVDNQITFSSNVDSIIKLIESKYNITVKPDVIYTYDIENEYAGDARIKFTYEGEKLIFLPVT